MLVHCGTCVVASRGTPARGARRKGRFRCHAECLARGDDLPRSAPSLLRGRGFELRALFRLLVLPVVGDAILQFTQSF